MATVAEMSIPIHNGSTVPLTTWMFFVKGLLREIQSAALSVTGGKRNCDAHSVTNLEDAPRHCPIGAGFHMKPFLKKNP